jgi:hypothetical protein
MCAALSSYLINKKEVKIKPEIYSSTRNSLYTGMMKDGKLLFEYSISCFSCLSHFIAPPHLHDFGKAVHPSVSCIAKSCPQALQCIPSCIFIHPFFP